MDGQSAIEHAEQLQVCYGGDKISNSVSVELLEFHQLLHSLVHIFFALKVLCLGYAKNVL